MTTTPAYTRSDVDRGRRMVRQLVEHYFDSKPTRLKHRGAGKSNTVFEVHHPKGDLIVRVAPGTTGLDSFLKEQWSVERARDAGVPVPEILEVGQGLIPNPYMIQRLLKGNSATDHPDRLMIIREMGKYARLINSIPTEGYGNTFDWSSNRLSFNKTFAEFLEQEYDSDGRIQTLKKHKMIDSAQAKRIAAVLDQASKGRSASHLAHGDLRLKNVLVDADGEIMSVLDWDNCCASVAPAWDLAIALHDLSIDGKEAFVEGYGLTPAELDKSKQLIRALNILHYAPYVDRAVEDKKTDDVQMMRARLSGALDLYAIE